MMSKGKEPWGARFILKNEALCNEKDLAYRAAELRCKQVLRAGAKIWVEQTAWESLWGFKDGLAGNPGGWKAAARVHGRLPSR
jgi:hypothetical protein